MPQRIINGYPEGYTGGNQVQPPGSNVPPHYEMPNIGMPNIPDYRGLPPIQLPEWYQNPRYDQAQDTLQNTGTGILEGNVPEYFKGIGETNSPQYQAMLKQITDQTSRAVDENLASRNIKGGVGGRLTSEAISSVSKELAWEDYTRAMTGKQFLMGMGSGMVESARNAELTMTGLRNTFNQNNTQMTEQHNQADETLREQHNLTVGDMELRRNIAQSQVSMQSQQINDAYEMGLISAEQRDRELDLMEEQLRIQEDANDDAFWSSIIGGGLGLIGTIATAGALAPVMAGLGTAGSIGVGAGATALSTLAQNTMTNSYGGIGGGGGVNPMSVAQGAGQRTQGSGWMSNLRGGVKLLTGY